MLAGACLRYDDCFNYQSSIRGTTSRGITATLVATVMWPGQARLASGRILRVHPPQQAVPQLRARGHRGGCQQAPKRCACRYNHCERCAGCCPLGSRLRPGKGRPIRDPDEEAPGSQLNGCPLGCQLVKPACMLRAQSACQVRPSCTLQAHELGGARLLNELAAISQQLVRLLGGAHAVLL